MGAFDDLIPSAPEAPVAPTPGAFDDLLPKEALAAPPPGPFDDLIPKEEPGVLDYLGEFGKRFVTGATETAIASPLKGYGARIEGTPESRQMEAAISGIQQGEDIGTAVEKGVAQPAPARPVTGNPLYQAGEAVTQGMESLLPDRKILNPVVGDIASGFGSVGANIALALTPYVGTGLAVAAIPGAGMGEAAERAVKAGATPEQQQRAAQLGTIPGATDFLDALLPSLGSTGKALGAIKRIGLRALEGAFVEGGQEGLQQFFQNLIAKGVYKPDQDKWEDVPYNAFIGGLVGGVTAGAIGGHGKEAPQTPSTPEELKKFAEEFAKRPPSVLQTAMDVPEPPQRPNTPVFYSELLKTASEKLPEVGTPAQILGTLRNLPGIKEEEISYSGLPAFLAASGGRVAKSEVVSFLEENQIRVDEIRHGPFESDPQYAEHVTPGKADEYREVLLTLPNEALAKAEREEQDARRAFEEVTKREGSIITKESLPRRQAAYTAWSEAANRATQVRKETTYTGGHWSAPNVVAHVRFSDRVDMAGRPVLFVEEFQSDWHSAGAKVGYKSTAKVEPFGEIREGSFEGFRFGLFGPNGELFDASDNRAQLEYLNNKLAPSVPDAPFKTTWPELTFKRMVRWAADNGYSRIAWVNGDLAIKYPSGGVAHRPATAQFLKNLYDRVIPTIARKWAKRLGGTIGETVIDTNSKSGIPADRLVATEIRYDEVAEIDETSQLNYWTLLDPQTQLEYGVFDTEAQATTQLQEWTGQGTRVMHLELPDSAKTVIQRGLPLFDLEAPGGIIIDTRTMDKNTPFYKEAVKMKDVLTDFSKKFNVTAKLRFILRETIPQWQSARGLARQLLDGTYIIEVALSPQLMQNNLAAVYATMMHEFGHIIMWEHFNALPDHQKLAIRAAFDSFIQDLGPRATMGDMYTKRYNAVRRFLTQSSPDNTRALRSMSPETRNYQTSFEEWFAEQVARWATTAEPALTIVERTFKSIGNALKAMFEYVTRKYGKTFRPVLEMQNWLNSYVTSAAPWSASAYAALDQHLIQAGQAQLPPNVPAAPTQAPVNAALAGVAQALRGITPQGPQTPAGGGMVPQHIAQSAVYASKINWWYKWMAGLDQLVHANPFFAPLLRYYETVRAMHVEESRIHDASMRISKDWRKLGEKQADALTRFVDDVTNMVYRTPQEVQQGISRHPTAAEAAALAQKHGLSVEAQAVATKLKVFFDGFLDLTSQVAMSEAQRLISDPVKVADRINQITAMVRNLKAKPYFPFMRFGRHYVKVVDAAGKTVHMETFETSILKSAARQQGQMAERLRQHFGPTHTVTESMFSEESEPFLAMPPHLLTMIQTKLNLTPAQLDDLQQLQYQSSPALSFRHRFQHKSYVPGYSMDFRRAFASYAFHGARFYSRTKYAWQLRQLIQDAKDVGGNRSIRIADYMADHLDKTILDAKGDHGIFKGTIFLWAMGYVPAAATQNMSQTVMITLPFLGAKYGDIRAGRAMLKAIADLTTFYKKGTYAGMTQFDMRAIDYGIKAGRISETQAAELAALSGGTPLLQGVGGNRMQRGWTQVMEKSASMFEMMEQFNRRVAYRAALHLALQNPNAKGVREAIAKYSDEYQSLLGQFTPAEASAIISASHAVDQTQYVYARYARPRFMRGKWPGTLLVFKKYMQSTLFLLGQNKADILPRYLVVAALVGGLGGLPGYDDFKELLRAYMYWAHGKDFNLDRAIREYIHMYAPDGPVPADMILHGLARRGLGIPALLDMLGSFVTGTPGRGFDPAAQADAMKFDPKSPTTTGIKHSQNVPFPVIDRSRALSMGNILPFEVGKLFGPQKDVNSTIADQTQKASGAVFSVAFNMFKAITDNQLSATDPKRWERAIPRVLAVTSKAFRALNEGRLRGRGGEAGAATTTKYDWTDPEQAMEIAAMAMGYQTLRDQSKWDFIMAQQEIKTFWDLKRTKVLGDLHDAVVSRDPEAHKLAIQAIKDYNTELPDMAKGRVLTGEKIVASIKTRERERISREIGIPSKTGDIGIANYLKGLFPETTIDVRRLP